MLRAALLVLCLAACGRFEFGLLPESADSGAGLGDIAPSIDAQPAACAVEGSQCDDLDICTTTSMCVSTICVGPVHDACRVAAFSEEYSDIQGQDSWFYGAWNRTDDPDTVYDPATDFESFAYYPGDSWRPVNYEPAGPNFSWVYIHWWGGHPAEFPQKRYPTRRWVSDVVGRASVVVRFDKADPNGGDGVGLLVYADGVLLLDREIAFDDTVGFTESLPVDLVIGTRIDVMMTYRGDEGTDTINVDIDL